MRGDFLKATTGSTTSRSRAGSTTTDGCVGTVSAPTSALWPVEARFDFRVQALEINDAGSKAPAVLGWTLRSDL
jgi:hypothetical protein